MGQAQREGCRLIPSPHRGRTSSALGMLAGASASTEVTHAKGSTGVALQKAVPSHLHLHHPVHKDSTHVPTDVCLLLHVVRKHEFFLPKSQLSGTQQTSPPSNKPLLTLCSPPCAVVRASEQSVALPAVTPSLDRAVTPWTGITHLSFPHVFKDLLGILCIGVGVTQLLLINILHCWHLLVWKRQQ